LSILHDNRALTTRHSQLKRLQDVFGRFTLNDNLSAALASLVAILAADYATHYTVRYGKFPESL
jgi:hypothetical protein